MSYICIFPQLWTACSHWELRPWTVVVSTPACLHKHCPSHRPHPHPSLYWPGCQHQVYLDLYRYPSLGKWDSSAVPRVSYSLPLGPQEQEEVYDHLFMHDVFMLQVIALWSIWEQGLLELVGSCNHLWYAKGATKIAKCAWALDQSVALWGSESAIRG